MKTEQEGRLIISLTPIPIVILILIIVMGIIYFNLTLRERNQLKQEQRNQIVAILGAVKETVTITTIKANWRLGSEYYAELRWSFHKPEDRYDQPPHNARVLNGQVIEVDGKPVKETLIDDRQRGPYPGL